MFVDFLWGALAGFLVAIMAVVLANDGTKADHLVDQPCRALREAVEIVEGCQRAARERGMR